MSTEPTSSAPPELATGAVLVPSIDMPEGAQKVEELDFNKFRGRAITVEEMLDGMKHMGFQASSMAEAIRIINDMVSDVHVPMAVSTPPLTWWAAGSFVPLVPPIESMA